MSLRPLKHWGHEFEFHSKHGCLCVLSVCRDLATGCSHVQVLPTAYRIGKLKKSGQGSTKGL
jgi:hypothetical protein